MIDAQKGENTEVVNHRNPIQVNLLLVTVIQESAYYHWNIRVKDIHCLVPEDN